MVTPFLTVIPVLVVAEHLLDEEACQVLRDALLQPLVAPLLGGDEAAVELVGDGVRRDRPRFIHLDGNSIAFSSLFL